MPTKKRSPRFALAIVLAVAICMTGLYFFSPANAGSLFTNAQSVTLRAAEETLILEPGDARLQDLKALFTEYHCFRSAKQLEDDGTLDVEDGTCFQLDISTGEKTATITIAGKYLVSGGNVWTVGLFGGKAEALQARLTAFLAE